MPLCTLEVSREKYEALPAEGWDQAAIALCEAALEHVHRGLEIPVPDEEWRILVRDGITESRLSVSFTLGSDEYGTGTIFKPSAEQIHATGIAVFESAQRSPFAVSQVAMEPWSETTFHIRQEEEASQDLALPAAFEDGAGREVGQPIVRLVVAAEALQSYQARRENEPSGEVKALEAVAGEMAGSINETLGLPENCVRSEVVVAHRAQTLYSVEVDFPDVAHGYLFGPEERLHLMMKVEKPLNGNFSTKEGSATFWVRQGKPAADVVTAASLK